MTRFPCPYLHGAVELTDERERHIAGRHPDLYREHWPRVAEAIADPDQVRRSGRDPSTRLLTRWFAAVEGGKYVVAAVVTEVGTGRHWLSTAYIARRLSQGVNVEWQRN